MASKIVVFGGGLIGLLVAASVVTWLTGYGADIAAEKNTKNNQEINREMRSRGMTPSDNTGSAQGERTQVSRMSRLMAEDDVGKAILFAKGDMEDTSNETNTGTVLLGIWSAKNLKWSDVARRKSETSFGKVKKDSSTEMGKRLCVKGRIISITRDKSIADSLFTGLLMAKRMNVISFVAVGDTGELVEKSRAKFCGIVTGNFSYSNSGGGTTHSVQLVGMFDLPGNKEKPLSNKEKRMKMALSLKFEGFTTDATDKQASTFQLSGADCSPGVVDTILSVTKKDLKRFGFLWFECKTKGKVVYQEKLWK